MECMNIKSLVNSAQNISSVDSAQKIQKSDRAIKSENTNERDGNGQELYSKQKQKQKMTEEQFKKALELLSVKPFMKEMNWTAFPLVDGDVKFVEIRDQSGEVIRRMSEFDLWEVFESHAGSENKGQLLKKSA